MKVIAFCGSPRKNGNTELLLKETVRAIEECGTAVEIFYLNSMKITPCQDCGGCDSTGECIYHDDMDHVYTAIRKADRIILASPIFFHSVSAQAKLMIDRCQSFWCEKYLLKRSLPEDNFTRKGLLLLVGGMKDDTGSRCAAACTKAFFRTISVRDHAMLSFTDIDAKGEILNHPSAIHDAYEAGRQLLK